MIHVKYDGMSHDIEFADLFPQQRLAAIGIADGAEPTPQTVTDRQIRVALAQYFDRGAAEFDEMYVEVSPNGNITVRPEASFG